MKAWKVWILKLKMLYLQMNLDVKKDTNTKRQLCEPTVDGVKGILTMLKEVERDLVLMLQVFKEITVNSYIAFNHLNNANNFVYNSW